MYLYTESHTDGQQPQQLPDVLQRNSSQSGAAAAGTQVLRFTSVFLDVKPVIRLLNSFCLICRLQQKRLYLQKQSQMQAYFNQMHIVEDPYAPCATMGHQDSGAPPQPQGLIAPPHQQQQSPQTSPQFAHTQPLGPLMEPNPEALAYEPYLGHYPQMQPLPQSFSSQLQPQQPEPLNYTYPACDPSTGEALYPEQYHYPLDPGQPPPPAEGGAAGYEGLALADPFLDSEMMETVDPQHGFVLVN